MADLCADGPAPLRDRAAVEAGRGVGAGHPGPRERQAQGLLVLHARAHRRHAVRADRAGVGASARAKRDTVLRAIMADQLPPGRAGLPRRGRPRRHPLHRRRRLRGLQGASTTSCPAPTTRPRGEERAWGRRLAKRFGVETAATTTGRSSPRATATCPCVLDHESLKPEAIGPDVRAFFDGVDAKRGDALDRLRLGHGRRPRRSLL